MFVLLEGTLYFFVSEPYPLHFMPRISGCCLWRRVSVNLSSTSWWFFAVVNRDVGSSWRQLFIERWRCRSRWLDDDLHFPMVVVENKKTTNSAVLRLEEKCVWRSLRMMLRLYISFDFSMLKDECDWYESIISRRASDMSKHEFYIYFYMVFAKVLPRLFNLNIQSIESQSPVLFDALFPPCRYGHIGPHTDDPHTNVAEASLTSTFHLEGRIKKGFYGIVLLAVSIHSIRPHLSARGKFTNLVLIQHPCLETSMNLDTVHDSEILRSSVELRLIIFSFMICIQVLCIPVLVTEVGDKWIAVTHDTAGELNHGRTFETPAGILETTGKWDKTILWKINLEPTNHPFRKENYLPNRMTMFHVNLPGSSNLKRNLGIQKRKTW